MRWRRTTVSRMAAWLGFLALAFNAAVPVFLAFLLSASLAPAPQEWARLADGGWRFDAPLCGHRDNGGAGDQHGKPIGSPCPVCSLHGVLAVALPAPVAAPAAPTAVATLSEPVTAPRLSAGIVHPGYRSRAPPTV